MGNFDCMKYATLLLCFLFVSCGFTGLRDDAGGKPTPAPITK